MRHPLFAICCQGSLECQFVKYNPATPTKADCCCGKTGLSLNSLWGFLIARIALRISRVIACLMIFLVIVVIDLSNQKDMSLFLRVFPVLQYVIHIYSLGGQGHYKKAKCHTNDWPIIQADHEAKKWCCFADGFTSERTGTVGNTWSDGHIAWMEQERRKR